MGEVDFVVGVRHGTSLALISYLDVITWEAVLFVPGSPLPSCSNMTIICVINIFILKWHLIKSSVCILCFKFFQYQRAACYYAEYSPKLGLLYWLKTVSIPLWHFFERMYVKIPVYLKALLSLTYAEKDQLLDESDDRTLQECFQWASYYFSINSWFFLLSASLL